MASEQHIKSYNATDIQKYHEGKLSNSERHALEKAALEDPFLADALEGYLVAGPGLQSDLADLRNRLANKFDDQKMAPVIGGNRNKWLRAAAVFVLIAGAATLTYKFGFDNKKTAIANTEKVAPDTAQSIPLNAESTHTDSVIANGNAMHQDTVRIVNDQVFVKTNKPSRVVTLTDEDFKATEPAAPQGRVEEAAKEKQATALNYQSRKVMDSLIAGEEFRARQSTDMSAAKKRADMEYYRNAKTFRGRVTDNNNNGLPFANVTNLRDNVGTYTDARGNFVLTSTDSVLNVQIRSNGFTNNNLQLRANAAPGDVASNRIVLQEDRSIASTIISHQKINAARRSANNTMVLETEPEPEDGWENYDSYLNNNVNMPEGMVAKQTSTGSVDVSFEVNKDGEPVNFKIEKSLCTKCDQEAIRLIKQGPKWKQKATSGRTTVTISF
jgi:hypothetical protein